MWKRFDDLPEHSGDYLVTYIDEYGQRRVCIAELVFLSNSFSINAAAGPDRANNDGHRWYRGMENPLSGVIGWTDIPDPMELGKEKVIAAGPGWAVRR